MLEGRFDAAILHSPLPGELEKQYVPFVGNGRIGFAFGDAEKEKLRIADKQLLKIVTDLQPLISVQHNVGSSSSGFIQYN